MQCNPCQTHFLNLDHPPCWVSSPSLYPGHDAGGVEIPLWSIGEICPSCAVYLPLAEHEAI